MESATGGSFAQSVMAADATGGLQARATAGLDSNRLLYPGIADQSVPGGLDIELDNQVPILRPVLLLSQADDAARVCGPAAEPPSTETDGIAALPGEHGGARAQRPRRFAPRPYAAPHEMGRSQKHADCQGPKYPGQAHDAGDRRSACPRREAAQVRDARRHGEDRLVDVAPRHAKADRNLLPAAFRGVERPHQIAAAAMAAAEGKALVPHHGADRGVRFQSAEQAHR